MTLNSQNDPNDQKWLTTALVWHKRGKVWHREKKRGRVVLWGQAKLGLISRHSHIKVSPKCASVPHHPVLPQLLPNLSTQSTPPGRKYPRGPFCCLLLKIKRSLPGLLWAHHPLGLQHQSQISVSQPPSHLPLHSRSLAVCPSRLTLLTLHLSQHQRRLPCPQPVAR